MADRVAIMHEGRLLASETKAALKAQRESAGVVRIRIPIEDHHAALLKACREHGLRCDMEQNTLRVRTTQTESTTRWLLETTQALNIKTSGLSVSESSLEDILFEWTKDEASEA